VSSANHQRLKNWLFKNCSKIVQKLFKNCSKNDNNKKSAGKIQSNRKETRRNRQLSDTRERNERNIPRESKIKEEIEKLLFWSLR